MFDLCFVEELLNGISAHTAPYGEIEVDLRFSVLPRLIVYAEPEFGFVEGRPEAAADAPCLDDIVAPEPVFRIDQTAVHFEFFDVLRG